MQSADGIMWREEFRPCPICSSEKRVRIGGRGGRFQRDAKGVETDVVRCLNCEVLYTYPTLLPESNPYENQSAEEYFELHNPEEKIHNGKQLATFAESVLGKPGKMLELGCGRGELLIGAAQCGWEVYGVEMTEHYAELARSNGIQIEINSIENSQLLNDKYDVIVMTAILEHLYYPMETLKKVRNALNAGGLVSIEVPNESSLTMEAGNLYMKARGRDGVINLSPTFPPFHVVGFSPKSLNFALKAAGLSVHTIKLPRYFNPIQKGGGVSQKVERSVFEVVQRVGEKIGRGDGIECWARREN